MTKYPRKLRLESPKSSPMIVVGSKNEKINFGTLQTTSRNWGGLGFTKRGMGEIKEQAPQWYSPLLSFINYYLPFDRATLYQYCRYWDTFHPLSNIGGLKSRQMLESPTSLKVVGDKLLTIFKDHNSGNQQPSLRKQEGSETIVPNSDIRNDLDVLPFGKDEDIVRSPRKLGEVGRNSSPLA